MNHTVLYAEAADHLKRKLTKITDTTQLASFACLVLELSDGYQGNIPNSKAQAILNTIKQ